MAWNGIIGGLMRLLVVEDDFALSEVLTYSLRQVGHAVDRADDGAAADQLLRSQHFDLIVLDLSLPRMDGLEVLRRLRTHQCTTPVLILSARDADDERVQGLDAGADDYLVKPFSINELVARVRALLRRSGGARSQQVRHARRLQPDGTSPLGRHWGSARRRVGRSCGHGPRLRSVAVLS